MLLSTQTAGVFSACGEDEGIKVLAAAGYDAIDYSMFQMTSDNCPLNDCDPVEFAAKLRAKAEAAGLIFNQAHAPFPSWNGKDTAYSEKIPGRIIQSIKIAGLLGAKQIIVHPIAYPGGEEAQRKFNIDFYRKLEPYALEYGIKIALENMFGHDNKRNYIIPSVCSFGKDLADYYDELDNPDAFTVCLDVGHSGLVGEDADHAIRALGHDRLGSLHVHDNDFRTDLHTLPYSNNCGIDWNAVTKALAEIDYKGEFTFEADNFLSRYGSDLQAAVNFMAQIGRGLIRKIEAAK